MIKLQKANKKYVIGVDGGGTKTITALADLKGRILKKVKTGPSSPRNNGMDKAAENVAEGINKLLRKDAAFIFVGLPAIEEEYKSNKGELEKKILNKLSFKTKIRVDSDQIVAFRSGTKEKSGVMVIAGTGCSVHGWRGGREAKVSGWGWLADEGSAVWTGRQVFEAVMKDIDNRGEKTSLTHLILKEMKVSTPEKLASKIYKEDFLQTLSSFSLSADYCAKKGDKTARMILRKAGEEIALAAETVIKNLGFARKNFPLVLVGSMFRSDNFRKSFELYIRQSVSKANIIYPSVPPVQGAVNLAIESCK
jgi:N-acetylglucosamine kinase-like BadF-type ATPase